jgi:D-3-phosphoglycerate dehydrogenase / 2-oxoglutarate reductase
MQSNLIIDFDSTMVRLEALDELANIALANAPDREERIDKIKAITKAGMEGRIAFSESLSQRLSLFSAGKGDIEKLTELLFRNITPSVAKEAAFIRENHEHIYVISGGFREYIIPVATSLGILKDHILANTFEWGDGRITGADTSNPLSQEGGKEKMVRELALSGPVIMVGDGYSDFLVRDSGEAERFIAFTENEYRNGVVLRADKVARNFHDVVEEVKSFDSAFQLVEAAD